MYTFLYDENTLKNPAIPAPTGIFFYIDNGNDCLYYYGNFVSNSLYYATLEDNLLFKGSVELPSVMDRSPTNLIGLEFFVRGRCVKIKQTVVASISTHFISDDQTIKEMLSVYDVPKELDPFFNVYDTIKLIRQCKDVDTLKLYGLSVLPYLHNCSIDAIVQFTDAYNNRLWENTIHGVKNYAYSII